MISDVDRDVTQSMLDRGFLQQTKCNDFAWKKQHHTFDVTLQAATEIPEHSLYLAPIPDTNAFIIAKDISGASNADQQCNVCRDKTHLRRCDSISAPCHCPCFDSIRFQHCNNTFSRSDDINVSPCSISLVDTQQIYHVTDNTMPSDTPPCFTDTCDVIMDAWRCELAGCGDLCLQFEESNGSGGSDSGKNASRLF